MREKIKKYWYVIVILLGFIPLYFIYTSEENNLSAETLIKEEIGNDNVELKERIVENTDVKRVITKYYIDIKGEVKHPGVYEIDSNSRVIDVINKAGGLTKNADTSILNLSKKVTDEMSIKIYSKMDIENAKDSIEPKVIEVIKEVEKVVEKECECKSNDICETSDIFINDDNSKNVKTKDTEINKVDEENKEEKEVVTENKDRVNINTASKEELMMINGIGEGKANKIIEYRSNNKFNKIEDIMNVSGIGESIFEKIKEYITV